MNVQKMGALCKKNCRLYMAYRNGVEWLSDGITAVELPSDFPTLPDERGAAAVFGWKDKVLENIETEMQEVEESADVFGLDMRDMVQGETACVTAGMGLTVNGMNLIVLKDDFGGIGFVEAAQLAPVTDEVRNSDYIAWYKRKRKDGTYYYVLKNGMMLRLAVMPVTFATDCLVKELEEIIDRMKRKAVVTDAEREN